MGDVGPGARSGPRTIRSTKRRVVRVSPDRLITAEPLNPERQLPLIVRPKVRGVDLVAWAGDNKEWLEAKLASHGGLIFEGFDLGVDAFEQFMLAISGELLSDPARYDLHGPKEQVYVTTVYPSAYDIFFHNETWWQFEWPRKMFFCCQVKPGQGGATTISDCRRVLRRLDQQIVEEFSDGLLMVRNFGRRVGLRPWQDVFGTDNKEDVESLCRRYDITWSWRPEDGLQTRHLRPVVLTHPRTGEQVWFNHAAHGHISVNTTAAEAVGVKHLGFDDLPMNTYYADGSPISDATIAKICEAYRQESVTFPWQPGNVMVIDNMLTAHGREAYQGSRNVLVGLAERCSWQLT